MEMTAETKTQKPKTQLCICQLRITLQEIRPPIWRLVQVPNTLRLSRLHDVLQTVIGWTDSHLHRFEKDGKHWGVPEPDEDDSIEVIDESRTTIGDVLTAPGDSMLYVYDFGDNWRHNVELERFCQHQMWSGLSALPVSVTARRRTSEVCQDTRNSLRSSSSPNMKSLRTTSDGLEGRRPSTARWDAFSRRSST